MKVINYAPTGHIPDAATNFDIVGILKDRWPLGWGWGYSSCRRFLSQVLPGLSLGCNPEWGDSGILERLEIIGAGRALI